jgi:NAD-dependent dihydropyrimidine dehydrogenase PreA subunit
VVGSEGEGRVARKWLPVIDTDMCGGCGECVKACEPDCIEMIWAFGTLVRPADCTSCGACEEVCTQKVIKMGWVEMEGGVERGTGRWYEEGVEGLGESA